MSRGTRKVLGQVPGQPNGPSRLERTPGDREGAQAPNPTHVNASTPQGVSVNPMHRSGAPLVNDWYRDLKDPTYAVANH